MFSPDPRNDASTARQRGPRPFWRRRSRMLAAAMTAVLAVTAVGQAPVVAKPDTFTREGAQRFGSVPVEPVKTTKPGHKSAPAEVPAVTPVWPVGVADVDLAPASRTGLQAGHEAGWATSVRAGNLPIRVTGLGRAATGRIRVQVLPRSTAQAMGVDGVVVAVSRIDGSTTALPVSVSVDYSAFQQAYGADWASRLRLIELAGCNGAAGCQPRELLWRNNTSAKTVTAQISAVPQGLPTSGLTKAQLAGNEPARTSSATMVALSAGPSGGAGDFAATSLSPASTWSHGGSTGSFSWSYPMRTPPAVGGPTPSLGFSYSSQSVDGRHAASNNQPGPVGEGFSFEQGFVERRYKACADDMSGGNNSVKTGDMCWGTDNALLSLGSSATELIKDAGGNWRPVKEDGSKIERLVGGSNGDDNGEYWKVTTANGTAYWFGLNRLPGWTSGKQVTNSAFTVPVAGNHTGEPCRQSSFSASFCTQAWRWSLDYVQDVFGNTMSLWYTPETNHYAKNNVTSSPVSYIRGGYLSRIDYGTDNRTLVNGIATDTVYTATNVPARVDFTWADRCLTDCWSGGVPVKENWKDTPWDQDCASTGTCLMGSPTFWSATRLTGVTTSVWKAATSQRQSVDSWTLRQSFPDPLDGTRAGLWLEGITHTGLNGTAKAVPEVTFAGIHMNNRVDPDFIADHSPPMNWRRIQSIRTEAGGEIYVDYLPKQCNPDTGIMPASEDNNSLRCFPVKWTPPGYTDPIVDYFHKYVVAQVQQIDHTGGAFTQKTFYEYANPDNLPLWHFDSADGLVDITKKSWGQWRGYPTVITKVGEGATQQKTETLYFRGMDGDKTASGYRTVTVQGLEGGPVPDHETYAGMARESLVYNGGAVASATVTTPWRSDPPSATRTVDGITVEARYVRAGTVNARTALDGGAWRRVTATTEYDLYGMPVKVHDLGQDGTEADNACTATDYVRNEAAVWILNRPKRVRGWAGSCDTAPTAEGQILGDTRMSYDDIAYNADPNSDNLSRGAVTKTETITSFNGGDPIYQVTSVAKYDAHGRIIESTDIAGEKTTFAHTPATGGPVTRTTVTNPLLWTSWDEMDPATGAVVKSSDVNGRLTEVAYDSLGRMTHVWHPDRPKATKSANVEYQYDVRNDGPSAVTTKSINAHDAYVTGYELFDSFLRPRQTQAPAVGGGRLIFDTFYDSAGRVWKTNAAYPNSSPPDKNVLASSTDASVPSQMRYEFDAAGRVINAIVYSRNVEKWRTSTVYHGDRVDTLPPQGASAATAYTDAHGRTTKLWQYHGPLASGGFDETRYSYDLAGRLASVIDASGNTWTHEYDVQGREKKTTDPDTGQTTFAYNTIGDLEKTTNAAGTLAYTYDRLGRPTSVRDDTIDGTARITWIHDAPAKGLTKSMSRWVNGSEYKSELVTADAVYRPTQTKITIPAAEGNLAGSYVFKATYRADGSPNTITLPDTTILPGAGGLAAEILTYKYDDPVTGLGLPKQLATNFAGTSFYVTDAGYTEFGEPSFINRQTSTASSMAQSVIRYDDATHRVSRRSVNISAGDVAYAEYTYDPAGNLKKIDDNPVGGQRDTQCFTYDHHRRLTQAWTPTSADCNQAPSASNLGGPAKYWQSWDFGTATDPTGRVGNRLKQTDHATPTGDLTTTYTYPGSGTAQPHVLTSAITKDQSGATVASGNYGYNSLGQTISRPGPTGQQTLGWDKEGHLATLSDTSGKNHSYIYDSAGNRLLSKEPGYATLHLGPMDVRLNTATGAVEDNRYYSFNGETVAQRTQSGVTWLAGDHQGTGQVAITTDTSQTVTRRHLLPFGDQRGSGAWVNPKGFVGGHNDTTGLVHLGAREYDKTLGRFISIDPVVDYGNPQQIHGYAYASNNPTTFSDPSGLIVNCAQDTAEGNYYGEACSGEKGYIYDDDIIEQICAADPTVCKPAGTGSPIVDALICTAIVTCRLASDGYGIYSTGECMHNASGAGEAFGCLGHDINTVQDEAGGNVPRRKGGLGGKGNPDGTDGPSKLPKTGSGDYAKQTAEDAAERAAQKRPGNPAQTPVTATPKPTKKPNGDCHSFAPDTEVLLADGSTKKIEDVQVGDQVAATDPETGETQAKPVLELHHNQDWDLATVTVHDEQTGQTAVLETTWTHPFWNPDDQTWTNAADLKPGTRLLDDAGKPSQIVVALDTWVGDKLMNDLTVADIHTYYVLAGTTPVLVHNCNTVAVNDAGRFGDLSPGPVGDGLTAHHMPQNALGFAARDEGGAIVMTQADHQLTRTYGARGSATKAAEAGMSFRDVLARDIWDIRRIGQSQYGDPSYFNKGIQGLLAYYRKTGQL